VALTPAAPTPAAPMLDAHVARKRVAGGRTVIEDLRFTLARDEIVAVVGPSGCGKTTLLRIVGGLDTAYEGSMGWAGKTPRIGAVFQEPRLLPWRTVRQNLALVRPPDAAETERLLALLGLAACADLHPPALSLGMARRAAIARAFAIDPELVLLDEPFVSLDPAMAEQGRQVLAEAWRRRGCAAILVTHDLAEAASLADRILLLSAGPARLVRVIEVPPDSRRRGIAEGARVAAGF
jgi:NitT/TauT family transport system ATP-binding protein